MIIRTALITSMLMSAPLMASESVSLQDQHSLSADSEIVIDVPVGELDIRVHDKPAVHYQIELKQQDSNWFGDVDLNAIQVDVQHSDHRLYLNIDEDDITQHWVIWLPRDADLEVDLGVGEVSIDQSQQDILVDVGVGAVEVNLGSDNYRDIRLQAGVGDADLRGFDNVDEERNMVSQDVRWRGPGQYSVDIEVGVGDINVRR